MQEAQMKWWLGLGGLFPLNLKSSVSFRSFMCFTCTGVNINTSCTRRINTNNTSFLPHAGTYL